jgi:uncharacterized protein YbjQ (UPF0145 family)
VQQALQQMQVGTTSLAADKIVQITFKAGTHSHLITMHYVASQMHAGWRPNALDRS